MSDERLRRLHRDVKLGVPGARAALEREKRRRGLPTLRGAKRAHALTRKAKRLSAEPLWETIGEGGDTVNLGTFDSEMDATDAGYDWVFEMCGFTCDRDAPDYEEDHQPPEDGPLWAVSCPLYGFEVREVERNS